MHVLQGIHHEARGLLDGIDPVRVRRRLRLAVAVRQEEGRTRLAEERGPEVARSSHRVAEPARRLRQRHALDEQRPQRLCRKQMDTILARYMRLIHETVPDTGTHVFRGQSDAGWPLRSGASRRLKVKFQSWYPRLFNAANTNQEMERATA